MEWWPEVAAVGTLVVGAATLFWRMLDAMRKENREAHASIGTEISQLRDNMGTEISQLRDNMGTEIASLRKEQNQARNGVAATLGSEIAQLREGQANLREGLGEIRGELTGIRHSVDTLRDDFRAHVLGGTAS